MNIKILLPVFNDWEALELLLHKIESILIPSKYKISYLVVNDCSSDEMPEHRFGKFNLQILNLNCNLGHQRAIAIGISYLVDQNDIDKVIVMDSDGEDMPEHLEKLISESIKNDNEIIFAKRNKRNESFLFRLFYGIYKMIFRALTGHIIAFGNYSIIPKSRLKKLAYVSEIWNNYPGGVIRSRIPYHSLLLNRGKRIAGESKMNFGALVIHGLSAIAVFIDFAAVRILIFAGIMVLSAVAGAGIVFYLKFIEHQATPGWASNLSMAFFIIFIQGFFITLFILFMILNSRRYNSFIPYLGYKTFIDSISPKI